MKYEVRTATKQDITFIAERLRKADRQEFTATTGLKPLALPFMLTPHNVKVWTVDGRPVCMFGIDRISSLQRIYAPWLMGTKDIEKHPIAFLRSAQALVSNQVGRLMNVVDARNTLHIKWLKWMGFSFTKLIHQYGAARLPFYRFEMINKKCAHLLP